MARRNKPPVQVGAKFNLKTWRLILELLEDRLKRGKTREWLKERAQKGVFQTVIKSSLQDTPAFKEIVRMSPDQFKEILNATEPDICKQSTKMVDELIVPV